MTPILDTHLDIAWNALSYDRDQLLDLPTLRQREQHMSGPARGHCTVSLPELRKAGIGVILATLLARALPTWLPDGYQTNGFFGLRQHGTIIHREHLDYANQTIAFAAAAGQLAYYQALIAQGHLRMIRTSADLDAAWQPWAHGPSPAAPIGFILSMEGADPIINPDHAQWWFDQGLRTLCLAHYGPSAYAMGTGGDGPITPQARPLLKELARLGIILDLVHTADTAIDQALDAYPGPVFVSHGNCRSLVPGDRQITDSQIRSIASRGGFLGLVMDTWMLAPGSTKDDGKTPPRVSISTVADHVDHICQLLGNVHHVALGSDLDGGFGYEQSPLELDSILDLHKIQPILLSRGYSPSDINQIFHLNALNFFRKHLPR